MHGEHARRVSWYRMMVQDHGGGGISLHGNIIVPSWTITLDHEGEKGREGAGEQESSSIPPRHGSTEDGGWRITGWKMIVSQPGGRSRWHVVMEYYCHIIGMEYYCNIIVREYQCWGRPSPHATPCSMVHVPWSATEPLPFPSSSSSPTSTASSSSPTSTSSSSPSPSPTWNPNPGNPNPDVEP
jgi:hypothetical protein